MLHISCPSCGERGKIPAQLAGVRIKCKKCGSSFQVVAPTRAHEPATAAVSAAASSAAPHAPPHGSHAPHAPLEGIVVEGLDPSAWSLAPDQSGLIHHVATVNHEPAHPPAPTPASAAGPAAGPTREYKLLTSRDKIFEGKFDIHRLEEALNDYARQGWTAKSMCLPHVKNFQGSLQEELVVLLER